MEPQESLVESGSREETGDDLLFVGRQGGAASVEAYLLILSVALLGFGLGATEGMTLIPMPFSAGSMFQPELLVIVIGACFSHFAERFDEEVAEELLEEDLEELKLEHSKQVDELKMKFEKQIHDAPSKKEEFERDRKSLDETLEKALKEEAKIDRNPYTVEGVMSVVGGVWIFGQLVLFSMLGSKTDVSVFQQIFAVLPIMIVGKTCRMLGVVAATYSTINFRVCESGTDRCKCKEVNLETWKNDALFCFLSTLPRATIQGALGPIPVRDRFFHSDQFRGERTQFIAAAARLYVVFMAVVGSILLDRYGVRALQKVSAVTNGAKRCQKSHQEETENWARMSMARRSSINPLAFENNSLAQRFSNASTSPSSQVQVSKDGLSGSQSQNRRGTMKQAVEAETEEPEESEEEVGAVSEGAQPTQPSVPRRGTIKQQVPIDEEESEADAEAKEEPADVPTEATPEAPPTDTQENVERPRVDTTQSIQSTRERGGTTDSTPSRREGKKVTFGTQMQMELQTIAAQVEDEAKEEAATLQSTASEGPAARTMPVPSTARQSMGAPRPSTFLRRSSVASSGRHSGPASRKMSLWDLEGKQKRPQKHSSASNATVETEQEGSDEEYDGGMHVSLQEIRPELRRQLASAAGRRGRGVRQEYMPVSQD